MDGVTLGGGEMDNITLGGGGWYAEWMVLLTVEVDGMLNGWYYSRWRRMVCGMDVTYCSR